VRACLAAGAAAEVGVVLTEDEQPAARRTAASVQQASERFMVGSFEKIT
jgi:hypothetical protein